jgi:flagellar motor switch protein FliN/FliY
MTTSTETPPTTPSDLLETPRAKDEAPSPEVITRVAEFLQLNPTVARGGGTSLEFLLDVNVPVSAELGHVTLPIGDVLQLEPGSVVELDREVSQPIDLTVCGVLFARGEVVVVEDRFAIRIKELLHTQGKKGTR